MQQEGGGDGGTQVGGALAIRPTTSLIPAGPSALTTTSGGEDPTRDIEDTVIHIKTTVIDIHNLLGESYAFKEKTREEERKRKEQASADKQEDKLEKDKGKESKFKIPKPKIVMSFWERIKKFFVNTFLGFIAVRLIPLIPVLAKIIPPLVKGAEILINIVGGIMTGLMTLIDWGYKFYDAARNWIGDTLSLIHI